MEYRNRINKIIEETEKELIDFNLQLVYDEENNRVPTQAFGEFLTNREQGDWAENSILKAINSQFDDIVAVPYGKNENLIAGDSGFKEFYKNYKKELCEIGKRPDILIFKIDVFENYKDKDLTQLSFEEQKEIVPKALAGLEVRSSAYLAKEYIPKEDRPNLTFTPKVEDFLVVKKWIDTFNVAHYYLQVFFDSSFIISYEDILTIIKNGETKGKNNKKFYINDNFSFLLDKAPKNQFKNTINIFLNNGIEIADRVDFPDLSAKTKKLSSGRLLNYITFKDSNIEINNNFRNYLKI